LTVVRAAAQIAIFVLPFVVLAGWVTGHEFSLALDPLSVVILTMSGGQSYPSTLSRWLCCVLASV